MQKRTFGRTGLEVSEIVFGGGFVGGLLILADDDTRRVALRRALDAGISWIDTAAMYGQGRSEAALGWLLAELDAPPRISTKVVVDPRSSETLASQVERGIHESLGRLALERVDLFQLHNPIGAPSRAGGFAPVSVAQVLGAGGAADGLDRVREQGLTDHVGLTALGDAPAIVEAIESGRFDSAQVYYNLINPSAARPMPAAWTGHDFSGVVDACTRQGTAVMGIRVFAAGVLASDARHGREAVLTTDSELDVEQRRAEAAFAALGDGHGTRAQTALRFALAEDALSCVVVGLAELSHLDQVIEAAAAGPLPASAVAALEPVYASNFGA